MLATLDLHAPVTIKKSILRPDTSWYTSHLLDKKRLLRKLETQYTTNPSPSKLAEYRSLKIQHRKQLKFAKAAHIASKFDLIRNDSKATHRLSAELLGRKLRHPLPTASPTELPILFSRFFGNKLSDIIQSLPEPSYKQKHQHIESSLGHFSDPSLLQVVSFIKKSHSSSSLDPIPTTLLHQIANTVAPPLLKICSQSMATGIVPNDFKKAIITPILKNSNLDSLNISNYRPISNLSIHSKTLERIVASQLTEHLDTNNILHPLQSAYTLRKSTETAMTKITSDLMYSLDNIHGTILVLLDMSAAFDTLDHKILINRLMSIGITGTALKWFESYLNNRTSTVCIDNKYAPPQSISHGVPQGSVLGPILFNIYMLPLFTIIEKHIGVSFHSYADDIQLYMKCNETTKSTPHILSNCISDIHDWLNNNSLRLNPSKSESIFLHLPFRSNEIQCPPLITSGTTSIDYSKTVRNLGVMLDSTLSFKTQTAKILKTVNYHLHCLRLIRRSIPFEVAATIASSFILPHFDYCNQLLNGIPAYMIRRLQTLQNAIVRCVHLLPRRSNDSITPFLKSLHWLPIASRILYKTILLTHKALHHNSPDYLASLINKSATVNQKNTRSTNTFHLDTVHKYKLHSTNCRSFVISAPYLWNSLPSDIRTITTTATFKIHLKTYLFKLAFD